jgi:hypothetical protein
MPSCLCINEGKESSIDVSMKGEDDGEAMYLVH